MLDETAPSRATAPGSTTTSAPRRSPTAAARQAIADGAPLVVVYPGVIYGPGELTEGNIVVRHMLDLVHRRLPALLGKPERRWNYVFVDDVAARHRRGSRACAAPGGALRARRRERHAGRLLPPGRPSSAGVAIPTPAHARRRRQGGRRGDEGLGAAAPAPRRSSPRTWSRSTATTGPTTRRAAERELGYRPRTLADGLARPFGLAAREPARWRDAKALHTAASWRASSSTWRWALIAFAVRSARPAGLGRSARVGAVVLNLFVLPRIGGRDLWRAAEAESGGALGIVLYPVAVLLLVLVFRRRLEVAAAAWGILAFGDGMASLVGMTLGRRKLPWNPRKSWAGTLAYLLFGTAGGGRAAACGRRPGRYALGLRARRRRRSPRCSPRSLESLPQGLDDNLGVPLVSGLFLLGSVLTAGAAGGAALAAGLAAPAGDRRSRSTSRSAGRGLRRARRRPLGGDRRLPARRHDLGLPRLAGLRCCCSPSSSSAPAPRSSATRARPRRSIAQEKGGRRGAAQRARQDGVAAACALFAATTALARCSSRSPSPAPSPPPPRDTVVERDRQGLRPAHLPHHHAAPGAARHRRRRLARRHARRPRSASRSSPALGAALRPLPAGSARRCVAVAAFVATTLESLVGATLEKRGLLDNEAVNFLNTLVGALLAAALCRLRSSDGLLSLARRSSRSTSQLARPFTLLPPLLGIISGAICAFGSVHNPDPARQLTLSVMLTVALGSLCAELPERRLQRASTRSTTSRSTASTSRTGRWSPASCRCARPGSSPGSSTSWRSCPPGWSWSIPTTRWREKLTAPLALARDLLHLPPRACSPPSSTRRRRWAAPRRAACSANLTIAIPRGCLLKVAGWAMVAHVAHIEPWFIGGDLRALPDRRRVDQGLRRHRGRPRRRLPDAADPLRRRARRRGSSPRSSSSPGCCCRSAPSCATRRTRRTPSSPATRRCSPPSGAAHRSGAPTPSTCSCAIPTR